jgi:hypothetical protein
VRSLAFRRASGQRALRRGCERKWGSREAKRSEDPQGHRLLLGHRTTCGRQACAAKEEEVTGRVPTVPTRGWMLSELDRRGVYLRGAGLPDAELVRRLRTFGLNVYESASAAQKAGEHAGKTAGDSGRDRGDTDR